MTQTSALIQKCLITSNLTQSQLARKMGWQTPAFLCRVIRGKELLPPQRFRRFAKVTGVDLQLVVDTYMADKKVRVLREARIKC